MCEKCKRAELAVQKRIKSNLQTCIHAMFDQVKGSTGACAPKCGGRHYADWYDVATEHSEMGASIAKWVDALGKDTLE